MNYRSARLWLFFLAASCGAGWLGGVWTEELREKVSEDDAKLEFDSLASGLGRGLSVAALGGYSNVAANFVWISMYGEWQYKRKDETLSKMNLAVALEPDSKYFWKDGARIIANDMPVWEIGQANSQKLFQPGEGAQLRKRYGKMALAFLDRSPHAISQSVDILRERAVIHWHKLDDIPGAIRYLKEAVEKPNPPYYLCRVYAEFLVKDGRLKEALEYLKEHYASLPDGDVRATKPLVRRRIAELEEQVEAAE